jgi:hypothetical protein
MTFCSLINKSRQPIPGSMYREVRFGPDESTDDALWHESTDLTRRESAFIIPRRTGVGWLWAKLAWENFASRYDEDAEAVAPTKYYAKFVREPFTPQEDQTGAQHFAAVPFGQNHVTSWLGTLRDGQPFALMVMHNGNRDLDLVLSEFKAWIP